MIRNVVKSLVAVSTIVACGSAAASVVVYTDRSAWETAVTGMVTENFNSFSNGTAVNGATVFPSAIIAAGTSLDISNFAFSSIGQGNALRTFSSATIVLPGSPVAFGFDYADLDLGGANIAFGGFSQALALTGDADGGVTPDDFAFFGVVATAAEIPGGVFNFTNVQEGFTIDNLSFASGAAVPEPATMALLGFGLAGLGFTRRRRHS